MGHVTTHVPFNVNAYVRVKLTDRGRELHRQQYDELKATCPRLNLKYRPVIEDEEGWSEWQMHAVMWRFGKYMIGSPLPFEPDIEILK